MRTPLDKALNQRSSLAAFTGMVVAATAWLFWSQDIFPKEADPVGNPDTWTREELRRWLAARSLFPDNNSTDEELAERVKSLIRLPKK